MLEDLPSLAKKAGGKAKIKAPDLSETQREIEATAKLGAIHLAACGPDYSACLAAIDGPPPVIAVRGNRALLNRQSIAMVGARDASAAGRRMARDLARDLGRAGYVIVSVMARDIDGETHAASMDTGTVAAIAGGIERIYPLQHEQIYGVLAQRDRLVSESPLGYVAQARDFPKRNRVISGLSLATVIVKAAERSGSLITARFALEQGAALIESAEGVLHAMECIALPTFDEPFAERFDARDAYTHRRAQSTPSTVSCWPHWPNWNSPEPPRPMSAEPPPEPSDTLLKYISPYGGGVGPRCPAN